MAEEFGFQRVNGLTKTFINEEIGIFGDDKTYMILALSLLVCQSDH